MRYIKLFENFTNSNFTGAISFTDWSNFIEKFNKIAEKGFTTDEEFISGIGFDYSLYLRIKKNLINNWIDSISKSLLHGIENIFEQFPKEGEQMFRNLNQQTAFLILCANGETSKGIMYGQETHAEGLHIISMYDLKAIQNPEYKLGKTDQDKKFITIGGTIARTIASKEALEKVNEVLQYVWCYYFLQKTRLSLGIQNKKLKLPKYLYRGFRMGNFKNIKMESNYDKEYFHNTKYFIDEVVKEILNKGLNSVLDGKFNSYTSSIEIAKFFTNVMGHPSGIIVRIDPTKVNIVASELTDEILSEPNPVTGKREKEYIVNIPANYKLNKDDIIIIHEDYYKAINSPLYVQCIDSNHKAIYDFEFNGKIYNIEATAWWRNNNTLVKSYDVKKIDGEKVVEYSFETGIKQFIKKWGFNPTPTEENLNRIKNYELYYNKGHQYNRIWKLVS